MEIDTAKGLAAQCWCDPRVSDREMDVELADVFAEMLQKLSECDVGIMAMIDTLNVAYAKDGG